MKEVAQKHVFR